MRSVCLHRRSFVALWLFTRSFEFRDFGHSVRNLMKKLLLQAGGHTERDGELCLDIIHWSECPHRVFYLPIYEPLWERQMGSIIWLVKVVLKMLGPFFYYACCCRWLSIRLDEYDVSRRDGPANLRNKGCGVIAFVCSPLIIHLTVLKLTASSLRTT